MKFKYFFSVFIITLCSLLIINVDNIEARGAARYETTGVLQSQVKLTTDRRMYNNFSGGYDSRLRAVTVNGVSVPAFCVDFGRVGTASLTQIPYQKDAKIDETTAIGRALTYAVLRGYSNDGNTAWYGANTVPALFKDYANFNNIDNRYYATQLAIWQINQC